MAVPSDRPLPPPPAPRSPGYGSTGPRGDERSPGVVVVLTLVTCGIYTVWWAYRSHADVKAFSGEASGAGSASCSGSCSRP